MAEGTVAVLSVPLPPREFAGFAKLSAAEADVVKRVLAGESGAQIAKARKVKRATIYKQLESAYRKLGVHSRHELASLISSSSE